ncbi:hypothetical protein SDC9_174292 [bioreactor metagenome]|uniref:Uncharacterized protein n=1 Tax=bioreactor metagenome TaxID=1076179 RepID=A0A645GKX2_9ZZZZ
MQFSNMSSDVEDALIPILCSILPILKPGVSFSNMNALMPLVPFFLSVIAITIYTSDSPPFVMNTFDPFITQWSSSNTATVCCPAASVPALGSVSPKAPRYFPSANGFRYFCFCSSVPNWYMGCAHSDVWAESITPVVAHTLDNSSTAMA